ncbi:class I SAM-dependent methyltransferase [bacterium]|nr:class I SAM-dependent methyltransferase [bacterium]MCI0605155.1 class I SAM-dependent methyltransferase [bacterium]
MKRDKFELYLGSVQTPEKDAKFLSRRFRQLARRPLRTLREDFCGTANLLCEFVKLHPGNTGIGVDSDPRPLHWCRTKNFKHLKQEQQDRVNLKNADVMTVRTTAADMIVAMNYSYSVFHTRALLLRYLKRARRSLLSQGIFLLDVHGGSAVPIEDQEVWNVGDFQYVWEVTRFDPVSHRIVCKIHFMFPDGTQLRNAFVYDWRLWTLPELRELFEDAGFRNIHVLWEGTDSQTELGNGVLRRVQKGHAECAWYAMVVGQK